MGRTAACVAAAFVVAVGAQTEMKDLVREDSLMEVLDDLQAIAMQEKSAWAPNGNRERSYKTHNATVEYLIQEIKKVSPSLKPQTQTYLEPVWFPGSMTLARLGTEPRVYTPGTDGEFLAFGWSVAARSQGKVVQVGEASSPASRRGCKEEDWANFPRGDIAMLEWGTCTGTAKVKNAELAGAEGVLMQLPKGVGPVAGGISSREDWKTPVFMMTYEAAQSLISDPPFFANMTSTAKRQTVGVSNVCVDLPGGDPNSVVLVGAHMDSVWTGPGINDNGSGSAVVLELVKVFSLRFGVETPNLALKNQLRCCWWASEEWGLLGSKHYVQNLTPEENARIAGYLNSDMAGSPNGGNFVTNTSNRPETPEANLYLQRKFESGLESVGQKFDNYEAAGTDYQSFFAGNIPAVALWSGIPIKTEAQAALFGGKAGEPMDPCYHKACDTVANIDPKRELLFGQMYAMVAEDLLLDPNLRDHLNRDPGATPAPTPMPRPSAWRYYREIMAVGAVVAIAVIIYVILPSPAQQKLEFSQEMA